MFYKQMAEMNDVIDKGTMRDLDFWLGTLTESQGDAITASFILLKFGLSLASAKTILDTLFDKKILGKHYIATCPGCFEITGYYGKSEVADFLNQKQSICSHCMNDYAVTTDNVFVSYRRILKPDMPENEIANEIMMYITNQTP